jgi:adenine-specific DNA-methyltransferase
MPPSAMPTLDFKGKQFVHSHHLSVPFRELVVDAKKSLPAKGGKPGLDDNLIIHGDNLEALKALLPTHAGKVDCIFIDPPYNTGNEGWCYNDNVRSPLMKEWIKKSANPVDKEDLERHDKWLCMMWPRLQLLRELLADDGIVFITIDDNEQHRLRGLLDEIFGPDCFVASVVWQKRTSPESRKRLGPAHDTIHVYSKRSNSASLSKLAHSEEQTDSFSNPDNDPKGSWVSTDMTAQNTDPSKRKDQQYEIELPNKTVVTPPPGRCWSMLKPEFIRLRDVEKKIWFGVNGDARPRIKTYLEESEGISSWTWWPNDEVGHNQEAKKEILEILGSANSFDYPKPVRLLARILQLATSHESLILDSFAGSGTTAHAVLAANAKDGGNRRFILVETENYADTLTAERVRRVIQGYKFKGTQRTELMSEKITWTQFKKAGELMEKVESIERLEGAGYDKVKKEIKDGVLTVTGEHAIEEKMPGLGGSFTYCELGEPIQIESLLTGDGLPSFEALARYVFYTATGQSLEKVPKPRADGLIGETDLFRLHLFYHPDKAWLRSNEAALDAARVKAVCEGQKGKRAIVFAVSKFMSQKELTRQRVEFCQLPYAVHRILGD